MDPDETQKELRNLREKVTALESEAQFARGQILQLFETLDRQEQSIRSQQSSVARLDRIQMEMLTGRVWRSLRAASDFAKRFVPSSGNRTRGGPSGPNHLNLDEPIFSSREHRSGLILVRGWALAETGVDCVRISIQGLDPIETQPSVARPDVKRAYPNLDLTGRSGFAVEFDSSLLPNGTCPIKLQLISQGKAVKETLTAVLIDHEHGFATDYDRWIHEFEKTDDSLIRLRMSSFKNFPKFSILMPVFNTEPAELRAALDSVSSQSYNNWELCIADDASSRPEVRAILSEASKADSRIRVSYREQQGGISQACNTAWQEATGDFITFLDHDDLLAPNALAYVVQTIEKSPEADLIYSDEDKVDTRGRRFSPFFKPDWSPDLLLSENYICHLLVLRRDLALEVGGFRSDCDGSQDYDLILNATARAKCIRHIPRVLYHWRAGTASTASTIENKQYAVDAAQRALQLFVKQQNPDVSVEEGGIVGRWRVRYPVVPEARVSIIIASGGKDEILRKNIESIFAKTVYANYEVVVIDNSKASVIQTLVSKLAAKHSNLRYIDHRNKPFNYSAINNRAARECDSPVLLFLNDDTSVISEGWLGAMVEQACRPEVGAVGARLLYPDGKIQHAGVIMGLYDNCGHAFKGLDGSSSHYYDFSNITRNVSAVTGACLMTRREVFWQVDGFDETDFAVAFNDVDLCLKIGKAGYRVIFTPYASLYHYEAFSKTSKDLIPHPEEVMKMRIKWDRVIQQDPFYSPNLTRNEEDYRLRTID